MTETCESESQATSSFNLASCLTIHVTISGAIIPQYNYNYQKGRRI